MSRLFPHDFIRPVLVQTGDFFEMVTIATISYLRLSGQTVFGTICLQGIENERPERLGIEISGAQDNIMGSFDQIAL
jgi:hypothetical protein